MTELILNVAEDLIQENGPYGFRLQDVADRLGVKAPALYNHFESRDHLVSQLARKMSELGSATIERDPGEDQMSAFRRSARRLVKYWYEHPAGARLLLWEIAQGGVDGWEESHSIDIAVHERTHNAFLRAVREGEFRDFRYEMYLSTLLCSLAGLVLWSSYSKSTKLEGLESIQREADDLVVRLLTPDEPLNRLIHRLWKQTPEISD